MKTLIKSVLFSALTVLSVNAFAAASDSHAASAKHASTAKTAAAKTAAAKSNTAVTFGVAADANKASYKHFAAALSKQLNAPVKLVVYSDPIKLANAVDAGKIDIAYMKPMPFVKAVLANKAVTPLATAVSWNADKNKQVQTQNSYLVTLASNAKINKVSDLNNAKIGFAKDSASGYYIPAQYLQQRHIAYSFHFFNSQKDALAALSKGKVDAIALWDPNFKIAQAKSNLKIINTMNNIPNPVIVAANNADAANIRQAIFALPNSAYKSVAFAGVTKFNSSLYRNAFRAVESVKGPSA